MIALAPSQGCFRKKKPKSLQATDTGLAEIRDFYYERQGIPGVCVFVDGSEHKDREQATRDREVREALRDRGYRVLAVTGDAPFDKQVNEWPDVFSVT